MLHVAAAISQAATSLAEKTGYAVDNFNPSFCCYDVFSFFCSAHTANEVFQISS
jgi:hypothetical protein